MINALQLSFAVTQVAAHGALHDHALLAPPIPANMGFEPVSLGQSFKRVPLAVNGSVPHFLRGSLYRGAPGSWPDGWWLDGLMTLNSFKFEAGRVLYSMQWNQDHAYNHSARSAPLPPVLDRAPIPGAIPHAANSTFPTGVAFREVQGALVSSTGVSNVNRVDPDTLEPIELPFLYDDKFAGGVFLAPTHAIEIDGHVLHHLVTGMQKGSGGTKAYIVTDIKPGTRTRDVVATIENPSAASWSGDPSFQHAPLATSEYYIMLESNCYYPDSATPIGEVDWSHWQSNLFARAHIRLVSRSTGASLLYALSYNVFALHHLNAYKDPSTNSIVVDTVQLFPSFVPCAEAFKGTAMSLLRSGMAGRGYSMSKLLRITLPLDKPGTTVEPQRLAKSVAGIEFPTIREGLAGKPYTYVYGAWMSDGKQPVYDSIIKVNVREGSSVHWRVDGHFPGEPIFVADPAGDSEDDGVVITNVLDTTRNSTYLVVLDGKTLEEKARAGPTPHIIPHGFHGRYFDSFSKAGSRAALVV